MNVINLTSSKRYVVQSSEDTNSYSIIANNEHDVRNWIQEHLNVDLGWSIQLMV